MEILAPAGSTAALVAAVENGADAVYLGGQSFSARASAANFNDTEMRTAMDYCHVRGVKVYVTVNTLLNDDEVKPALHYLADLYKWGADAVIIQDLGLAKIAQEYIPELELHASTQMTLHNTLDLRTMENLGIERVVLARELSIGQISEIAKQTTLEIEVFGHGAICLSYSGQCLMSSLIGGRSGNRGRCAQPCRQMYNVDGVKLPGPYVLSPRDLKLIEYLPDLKAAGVTSLKIEGRLKNPEYVGSVTRAYRAALNGEFYENNALTAVFNRGFTTAYATGKPDRNFITYGSPKERVRDQQAEKDVAKEIGQTYLSQKAIRRLPAYLYAILKKGESLQLTLIDNDGITATVQGAIPAAKADHQPLTKSTLEDKLVRMGNDPLNIVEFSVEMEPELYLPVSELKTVRRNVVQHWMQARLASYVAREKPLINLESSPHKTGEQGQSRIPQIAVTVSDLKSAREAIAGGADLLYFSGSVFKREPHDWLHELTATWQLGQNHGVLVYAHLERITNDKTLKQLPMILSNHKFDGVLVGNFGAWEAIRPILNKRPVHTGESFNLFNNYAADLLADQGASVLTASLELTFGQIGMIVKSTAAELAIIAHGPLESMVSKHCIWRDLGCRKQCETEGNLVLQDGKGYEFPVAFDRWCHMHLYNSRELSLLDRRAAILASGVAYVRIEGRTKSPKWIRDTVIAYKELFRSEGPSEDSSSSKKEFTHGHYFRGVQ